MSNRDHSTPSGLLHCLRMLADEASSMQLTHTLTALQQAMETCRVEAIAQIRPDSSVRH